MTSGLSLSVFVLAVGGALRFTSHTKHSWRHNVATLTKIFAYQEKMFEWVSSSVRKFTVKQTKRGKSSAGSKIRPIKTSDNQFINAIQRSFITEKKKASYFFFGYT